MTKVFLGGSRHVSRLAPDVRSRIDRIMEKGLAILVGDAPGADRALQQYLHAMDCRNVTVFCSGSVCRNNVGNWETRKITAGPRHGGFAFFVVKDREMAREADYGLMVWDGRSSGTIMNALRLLQQGKKVAIYSVPEKRFTDLGTHEQWDGFIARHGDGIRAAVEARLTPDDLVANESLLPAPVAVS